ncbi:MAG: DUF1273 domain-containing protein [Clostridiales bacterium]|nr:DUF1273 domain-containing protein [Clostridiales bacterium]
MTSVTGKDEYALPKELSVSFTGHRADKLPWGANERDERAEAFKKRLEREVLKAYKQGARYFLSGMADGVDLIAAETVLRLRAVCPGMELVAVFPFGTGDTARKRAAAKRAEKVVSLHKSYVTGCYQERNRFLTDHSVRMICGFGGDMSSGTGQTMLMARKSGLDLVIIDLQYEE